MKKTCELVKLFKWQYDGFEMMKKSRQKSAKKRRVLKKWKKRFGHSSSEIYSQTLMTGNIFVYKIMPHKGKVIVTIHNPTEM